MRSARAEDQAEDAMISQRRPITSVETARWYSMWKPDWDPPAEPAAPSLCHFVRARLASTRSGCRLLSLSSRSSQNCSLACDADFRQEILVCLSIYSTCVYTRRNEFTPPHVTRKCNSWQDLHCKRAPTAPAPPPPAPPPPPRKATQGRNDPVNPPPPPPTPSNI